MSQERRGKYALLGLLWLALAGCAAPELSRGPQPVTVSLVSFNDFHGQLLPGTGSVPVLQPETGMVTKMPAGGAAYLAGLIDHLRAQNPERTLVVAAGDLIGASPLVSSLFHDEPAIEALNRTGLAVSSVGNHEFEKGVDELLRMQNGGCFPKSADGTQGVIGIQTSERNGKLVGAIQLSEHHEVLLISDGGTLVRTRAAEIAQVGRNTQGVTLIRLGEGETLQAIERVDASFDDEDGGETPDA